MGEFDETVEGQSAAAEAVADASPQAALSTALRELAGAREGLAEIRTDDAELLPVELEEVRRQLAVAEAALQQVEQGIEAERAERTADLQRLAADFDNYRKRVARDQAALVQRAHEKLVRELLPVLDDMERALRAVYEHEEAQLEQGVRLVHENFRSLLEREGLAEIETDGKFDPHVHEALVSLPSDEEEGTIVDVHQKGYRLGDQVLRPARVAVAGPKAEG
jgi:molecular chaperone GrpE